MCTIQLLTLVDLLLLLSSLVARGGSTTLDDAIQSVIQCFIFLILTHSCTSQLIDAGIHVVVVAGNDAIDASTASPARVAGAITVGATDIYDAQAVYSNYGKGVDIFAPGSDIISTSNQGGIRTLSGTSMA